MTENIASCSCSCDHDGILEDFDPVLVWFGEAILLLKGDWIEVCWGFEFAEDSVEDFFLFGVTWGIEFTLEFLDRVLMVLVRFFEVQGRIGGGAEETFLQLLLLFLISTLVE